ncbi:MAG: Fe-S protein assembly co-chaperone HscB [Burkholderiales bacterium]|nr:Fe-S protein assembly co-chaperone HscB [Burkholderiales bacterium]
MSNHFELFGLAPKYALDAEALERAWRAVQASVHPDRYAAAGAAERRAALAWSARANEAYRMLKDPVERARHLLELAGVDPRFETDTAMPEAFLERQLELREALAEARAARDAARLAQLREEVLAAARAREAAIAERIDVARDYAGAAALVRELQFLRRLAQEIDDAHAPE